MPGSNPRAGAGAQLATSFALAAAHALLFAAAFAPVYLWPLIALAPAPLTWLAMTAPSTRHALLVTLAVQTAMWLWMGRWLVQITEAGYPFYAVTMALAAVAFVWAMRRISLHGQLKRLPTTLTLPIVWVGIEFFRGEIFFDGYPWFLLAHPIVEAPVLAQSADLFGTYFVSFLLAMVAGLVVDAIRARRADHANRALAAMAGLTVLVWAGNIGYGAWRLNQQHPLSPGPTLLVIQTNLPQDNKMRSSVEDHWDYFQQFLSSTEAAYEAAEAAGEQVDLIIWPETMVQGGGFEPQTLDFYRERDYWPGYRFALSTVVAATDLNVPMLVGSPAQVGVSLDEHHLNWDAYYNAAYLIMPEPEIAMLGRREYQRYDKIFLTPFGETMPYIRAWPWLEERLLALGAQGMRFDLDHGSGPRVLELPWRDRTLALATPICFEATMAHVGRALAYDGSTKRADVMINMSNDGWFGFHGPGREQHAQISRYRAIENRVPMVRAANTGMSVSIDSAGRVVETIGEGRYGVFQQGGSLLAKVQLDSRRTVYGMIGNVWGWASLLGALALIGLSLWRKQQGVTP